MPGSTSPRGEPRPAVFLDRDGTVIRDPGYLSDPAGVELYPGAGEAIARLNRAGLPVVLVTNQSGMGRGYYGEAEFQAVQRRLAELLEAEGARLDGVYHCPHAPGVGPPCDCRKPAPGLFHRAARELALDLRGSYYVGDRVRDVLPGRDLGGTGILVPGGEAEEIPPGIRRAGSLPEAVEFILLERAEG